MVKQPGFSIRKATHKDRQHLANLIHFEVYVHRHLDWRPPLDWMDSQPFLIAEQRKKIVAALACPPDPPRVAWIRLFAVSSETLVRQAWDALWPEVYTLLGDQKNLMWIAAIPLHDWFRSLLERSGFQRTQNVVMLIWEQGNLPQEPRTSKLTIRPMTLDDLSAVENIDEASFVPVWQNSQSSLELAFRQAVVATVAEDQGKLVGYQISTSTPMGGHLARLAVMPQLQGQGIGYALLYDLLQQFERRGARTVSVNTQQNNLTSLALYKKAGFQLTGEEYSIYQLAPHRANGVSSPLGQNNLKYP